ncbi:DUF2971 domain-containing protein [Brevundimonas aurantiaca]|uniref:DUF2971 domain-containing protein n=1 Tax=Brevundimonas aurantiaca TaxID=74316 RepID=UPI001749D02E|nr:DUF2971 domain-containing protein [Brevundimonas aurantiaca]
MAEFVFSKGYVEALVRQNQPSRLYKYRSLAGTAADFCEAIVVRSEVYFAKPDELNDPFDCRPHNTLESSAAERRAFWTWVTKGREPHLSRKARRARVVEISAWMSTRIQREGFDGVAQAAYDHNLRDTGVLSLSAEPRSNLMWSHYGDAHRGICVEFDFEALKPLCPLPVTYSNDRPSYNMMKDVTALGELAFLRKSSEWEYEQEWRAVGLWWSGPFRLPADAVSGIILGAGISADDRKRVMEWVAASSRRLDVRQARFESKSYALTFGAI